MRSARFALHQMTPLIPSYFFVGIASGLLMTSAGYNFLWSVLAGLIIYAGSMQIVMVPLITGGSSLWTLALMTIFINGRHIFYGLGMIDRFKTQGKKSIYMALVMTDETYSLLCNIKCPDDVDEDKVDFFILFFCHILWIVSCTVGALFGEFLPFDMSGIEFSATAFFTVVVVNQWLTCESHVPAIIGLISSICFWFTLGPDKFILPSLSISALILTLMKDMIHDKRKEQVIDV